MDLKRIQHIGMIAMDYYKQIPFTPTEKDFEAWIDSLKQPMKSNFKKDGFMACRGVLNFKRFWLEMKDFGMEEYMKKNLSAEDYEYWIHPKSNHA